MDGHDDAPGPDTISEDGDEETICFYGDSNTDDIKCIPEMNNDSKESKRASYLFRSKKGRGYLFRSRRAPSYLFRSRRSSSGNGMVRNRKAKSYLFRSRRAPSYLFRSKKSPKLSV